MAQYSYPFDSINNDRTFNSEKDRNRFKGLISNGVLMKTSSKLQVVADKGMKVNVKEGMAWLEGAFYYNDADLQLTISTADTVNNRIDSIVLRLDLATRNITANVKKGTPSLKPVAPVMTRNVSVYEICLANILVSKGASSISNGDITDTRFNNDVCGIVTGVIEQIDTTNLFNQFTSAFTVWFDEMKGKLTTDQAGNLQKQITDLKAIVDANACEIVTTDRGSGYIETSYKYGDGRLETTIRDRYWIAIDKNWGEANVLFTHPERATKDFLIPFIEPPRIFRDLSEGTSHAGWVSKGSEGRVTTTNSGKFMIVRPGKAPEQWWTVVIKAEGRWK